MFRIFTMKTVVFIAMVGIVLFSRVNVQAENKQPVLDLKFEEETGTIIKDASGNNNDAAICGAQWQKEDFGYAISFSDVDQYIEVKDSPSLKLQDFTVEIWVKLAEMIRKPGLGSHRLVLGKNGELWDPESSFGISYNGSVFISYVRYGKDNTGKKNDVLSLLSRPVRTDKWYYLVFVKSGKTLDLYLDGTRVTRDFLSENQEIISSSRPIRIGCVPSRPLTGAVSGIRIYDYGKDEKQIKDDYENDIKIKKIPTASTKMPEGNMAANKKGTAYFLLVTSLDSKLGAHPLLDISEENVKTINNSPYDGVALSLEYPYDGLPVPDMNTFLTKAEKLRESCKKQVWPRVYVNRILQMSEVLRERGVGKNNKYFDKIKLMDIYDEAGTLSDFYKMWRISLRTAKALNSPGISPDFEVYNVSNGYHVDMVARAQGKSEEEVVKRLQQIGSELADIVHEEYPKAVLWSLFTFFTAPYTTTSEGKKYYTTVDYIFEGMLDRAKEKNYKFRFIDGGEVGIGYVFSSLDDLKDRIERRNKNIGWVMQKYPGYYFLGGTFTAWDDDTKITGWVRKHAGENPVFKNLSDFKPVITELFSAYDYIWSYVPTLIVYNPFVPDLARSYNEKLCSIIKEIRPVPPSWEVK